MFAKNQIFANPRNSSLWKLLQLSQGNKPHQHQRRCAVNNLSPVRTFSTEYSSSLADSFYNEEQKKLQTTVSKIVETEILPHVEKWENAEEFPSHFIIKKFGNASLLGIRFDTDYGGLGFDYKYHAAYLEELGSIPAAGICAGITAHTEITLPALARFGSAELKSEFLSPSIAGDVVACLGVSEPQAGSDVANIKTSAVRTGDDLIINGQKTWITNGLKADWICLLANTSQGSAHKNKSLICVPMNSKGISRTKIHKLGWNSSDTAQLFFEDVRVPAKNIIGDEGSGFMYQMLQFQEERLCMALVTLRALDKAISDTIEYTRQRQAFGRSILDNQVVHFRLAELATEIEALRALTYRSVEMMVNGENVTRTASMVKLKAGRLSRLTADSCLQFFGGMGYTRDVFISRFFRDGRLTSIGGGADEIMLEIITRVLNIAERTNK
ncbi:probable acyl-CoA dehydrogenase 6 [Folsomia candida]|uniref:probable acyl-CoA dehydrogenase 6 n=1 Tax=Folsomia candida TaxID=158441 RepID=UPI000B901D35|nr:probable acyl-CoA dehydrogenase 6 [Folsomia candida]